MESDTVFEEDVFARMGIEFKLLVELFKVDKGDVKDVAELESFKFFSRAFVNDLFFFLSSFSRSFLSFLIELHCSLHFLKFMAKLSTFVTSL